MIAEPFAGVASNVLYVTCTVAVSLRLQKFDITTLAVDMAGEACVTDITTSVGASCSLGVNSHVNYKPFQGPHSHVIV